MRGRATAVVLPALVVLGLVAVVAIAATGHVATGSGDAHRPSETLLDTLFTLWIVAVVAGGILLVYGLMQRQAIARQIASGRYPRVSVVAWVIFVSFITLLIWAFTHWTPAGRENVEEEGVFGGTNPLVPTTPENEATAPYEPSLTWIPIAVVVGLVLAGVVAYVISDRRARRTREAGDDLTEQLAVVLDETLDDLRAEADPRRAIIAAYARLERVLAANGIARRAAETSDEYLARVLHDLALGSDSMARLTRLFKEAKFSHHHVDSAMKEEAIDALEQARDELRKAHDSEPAASDVPAVVAST